MKIETVSIVDKAGKKTTFKIWELSVHEIRFDVLPAIDELDGEKAGEKAIEILALCTNATADDLAEMYPSDIEKMWDKFKKANSALLKMAQKAGLPEQIQRFIRTVLTEAFADLSATATPTPGNIPGLVLSFHRSPPPPSTAPGSPDSNEISPSH